MDEGSGSMPPGTPRRRLGNFRSPALASRVREVLAEAGIPSSGEPDPGRPEWWGRLLDRMAHLAGVSGNRVWVPRDRTREAARVLAAARRRGDPPPGPKGREEEG
ncbi:MAG TPA: hypothetical protein VF468_06515 [Actinomycetota bacterium]|jgi:hypothetical protein|nr:hypothetical protein [Actinomycetota bacterium]